MTYTTSDFLTHLNKKLMEKERKSKHFINKPIYEGGSKAMKQFIADNLVYPKAAKDNKIEGTVSLRYTIDYKGNVIKVKMISGIGYGCDEEAIRLVKELKFFVGKNRKKRMIFHKTIHIHFGFQKKQAKAPIPTTPLAEPAPPVVPKPKPKSKPKPKRKYNYVVTPTKKENASKPSKSYSITINY